MSRETEQQSQAHEPVLLQEVIDWLQPQRGGVFVDCTLGLGGHAEALLRASPEVTLIGIDRDQEALGAARERLKIFENRFRAVHGNFETVAAILHGLNLSCARGILADLGVSSLQLDKAERGFSFATSAPLDMRMDQSAGESAADLVNGLTEAELADLIFDYSQERGARKIARAVIRERQREPIITTDRMAAVVIRALRVPGRWRIHPATRTFQALRIAVNGELDALKRLIPDAVSMLEPAGRLAVISFHSLEDRVVKQAFLRESGRCICEGEKSIGFPTQRRKATEAEAPDEIVCDRCGARKRVRILTRKPIRPSEQEVARNPRSRSAMLRVCEKP
ncbi:MAG TPA: 16S rRNA (cytosine(1402)-N(4))-methyltransferase RsmH [Blastocatellia bacterium]|jgi:16S rRNA (cytosine1402-N4)-methyltransferase|nr:16S rRNA (cytosine(1402)-N(4))-methyltransferase RsmH [Blastocatellia bacterium]